MNTNAYVSIKLHIPLLTESKLFCACPTTGGKPNECTCPVCMGAFGSVPALNRSAMMLGILVGLAFESGIGNKLIFDKMPCAPGCSPKGYRMAQTTAPVARGGHIDILSEGKKRRINLSCCSLEEGYRIDSADFTGTPDYNICGIPIVTVQTAQCVLSGAEVRATVENIISLLHFLGATAMNTDEKNIPCEIRISVGAPASDTSGTRLYIKGSPAELEYAADFEIGRQMGVIRSGSRVTSESVTFDRETATTVPYTKNIFCFEGTGGTAIRDASITPAQINELYMRAAASVKLDELPLDKLMRYTANYGVSQSEAKKLSSERAYSILFEYCAARCLNIKQCAHWISDELDDIIAAAKITPALLNMECDKFAALMNMLSSRLINEDGCRQLLCELLISGSDPFDCATENGLLLITDSETIVIACRVALRRNLEALRAYLTGNGEAFEFLVNEAFLQLNEKSDKEAIKKYMEQEATCEFLAACDMGEIPFEAAEGSALQISTEAKGMRLIELVDSIPDDKNPFTPAFSRQPSRYEIEMKVKGIVDRSCAQVDAATPFKNEEVKPSYVDARPYFPETSPMSKFFLYLNSPMPAYDSYYDNRAADSEQVDMPDIDRMIFEDMMNRKNSGNI